VNRIRRSALRAPERSGSWRVRDFDHGGCAAVADRLSRDWADEDLCRSAAAGRCEAIAGKSAETTSQERRGLAARVGDCRPPSPDGFARRSRRPAGRGWQGNGGARRSRCAPGRRCAHTAPRLGVCVRPARKTVLQAARLRKYQSQVKKHSRHDLQLTPSVCPFTRLAAVGQAGSAAWPRSFGLCSLIFVSAELPRG